MAALNYIINKIKRNKMKKISLVLIMLSFGMLNGQELPGFDQQLSQLTQQLDSLITQKNLALQKNIESLNQMVKEGKITSEEAQKLKMQTAKKYADEVDYIAFKISSQIKDLTKGKLVEHKVRIINGGGEIDYTIRVIQNNRKQIKEKKKKKRTSSDWFLSFGLNNVLTRQNIADINDSPYGIGQSRFFRVGKEWKTSLTKNRGPIFFTYGIDFTWNTLKPNENKYHLVTNDELILDTYPKNLRYSKLRTKWLRAPIGIEWDIPSNKSKYLKLKAGAFARINLSTKQKLKVEGEKKIVEKSAFDVNGFNYGVFGEIGGRSWSLSMDYDALSFFKSKDWRHFMLGLKWNL